MTLVTLPRLDRATQSSAWFEALAGAGVTVAVYPVERDALPAWIAARMKRHRQRASRETLAFLADHCEGNLLAARQEIEKLALLLPEGELAQDAVEAAIADVARYDVFQLSEAWLAGDARACGAHPARARSRGRRADARDLAARPRTCTRSPPCTAMVREGTPVASAMRNARVWGKRQNALERAVKRVAPALIRRCC